MRVMSMNLNGIRSAARKGFFEWAETQEVDVFCFQELKAQDKDLQQFAEHMPGYHRYYHCAKKKGYSGVGILTREEPKKVISGLGWKLADDEGRYLQVDFDKVSIVSLYLPSGTSGEERQAFKYKFLDYYERHLLALRKAGREFIICGDWNIAHTQKDLKNWKTNQKNSGFLPEERAWMDKLFGEHGWVDGFRVVNQEEGQYTWWSYRQPTAFGNNVGWRIDYQVLTPALAPLVTKAFIHKENRFSDHAPLIMDYDL